MTSPRKGSRKSAEPGKHEEEMNIILQEMEEFRPCRLCPEGRSEPLEALFVLKACPSVALPSPQDLIPQERSQALKPLSAPETQERKSGVCPASGT